MDKYIYYAKKAWEARCGKIGLPLPITGHWHMNMPSARGIKIGPN